MSVEVIRRTRWAVKLYPPFSPNSFFLTIGVTYRKGTEKQCAGLFINLLVFQVAIYTAAPGQKIA